MTVLPLFLLNPANIIVPDCHITKIVTDITTPLTFYCKQQQDQNVVVQSNNYQISMLSSKTKQNSISEHFHFITFFLLLKKNQELPTK